MELVISPLLLDFDLLLLRLPDWFKAGKGPDPKVASLDRSLDNYWNSRNKAKSEGTEQKASTGAIVSDAAEPSEGADAIDPDL